MSIGDLVTENQPPSPATRREIAAALDKVQKSFELLGDAMNSVAEISEDAIVNVKAAARHRVGMAIKCDILDAVDRRLVDARSVDRRRVSRTKLTEIALERILQLDDVAFAEAMREPEASGKLMRLARMG